MMTTSTPGSSNPSVSTPQLQTTCTLPAANSASMRRRSSRSVFAAHPRRHAAPMPVEDLRRHLRRLHARREHQRPPGPDDRHRRRRHRLQVLLRLHHGGQVAAVQVAGGRADAGVIQPLHVHHLLLDRHQPAVVNRVQHLIVERHRLEHLPERLLVGAVRRRRHAQDLQRRVGAVVVNHPPVARRRRMVRLVNDQQAELRRVELRHSPAAVPARALRLDGRDDHPRRAEQAALGPGIRPSPRRP